MEQGHFVEFIKATTSGRKEAIDIFLFVGVTVAIAAAIIAFLAVALIAWPLYLVSGNHQNISLRAHLLIGLIIALIVGGILLVLQHVFYNFPAIEYWFEVATIIPAGLASALAFWTVTHAARINLR
ncbi:MAG TPA: hypothetical protein VGT78_01180 [Rhizomicrobium sp.]|nr:hypothetical protein [Rhizomicrobium sp.]